MEQFPPNSRKSQAPPETKRVEQVTSATAVRRRRPLGKQFRHTFFGGDAKTAAEYMVFEVLIPSAKEALVEAMSSGFERLVYGDRRPRRPGPRGLGHFSYNQVSQQQRRPDDRPPGPMQMSRQSRARHDFGQIVLQSRQEAEEVIDRLFDLVSKFGEASVSDLYELTGIASSHVDKRWGWTNLRGASVGRVRGGGYVLDLPEPETLT